MVSNSEIDRLLEMGEALLQVNNAEGALATYEAALGFNKVDRTAMIGKTISLLNLGRTGEALQNADLTAQKHPDDASLWEFLGITALAAGKAEQAIRAFLNQQKVAGTGVITSLRLAEAYYFAIDIENARQFVERALREQPGNREAQRWREKLAGIKDKASLLVDVGEAHCQQGRVQQGVELFRQALTLGDLVSARLDLARSLIVLEQLQEAIAHLKSVLERDKKNQEALTVLANAYLLSGENEKARQSYISVLSLSPNNLDAFNGIAKLSMDAGSLNEAESYIEQSIRLDPSLPEAWLLKARLHIARGEEPQARQSADHAIFLDTNSAVTWALGKEILRKQGKSALAELYLNKVRKLAPGQIKAKPGSSQEELERAEVDSADLESLSDPKEFAGVCRERAVIYALIAEPEQALYYIKLLRGKYPEFADEQLFNQQGALLMALGRHLEARQCFEEVLKINSSDKTAQSGLKDIERALAEQVELRKIWQPTASSAKEPAQKTTEARTGIPDSKAEVKTLEKLKPEMIPRKPGDYCRKCGNKFSATAKFCNKCGTPRR